MNTGIYSTQSCLLKMQPVHRPSIFSFKEIPYTQNSNFAKRWLMALLNDFEKIECPVLLYLPENEERFSSRNSNFVLQLETRSDIARSKILVARLYNEASKFLICFEQSIKDFMVDIFYNATLLRRCSGCDSYTRKNRVNLYQWSDDPQYARLWMSAVKNT